MMTKTVDGKALTADKFAYVGDPEGLKTWHLPLDEEGRARAAFSRFDQADMPDAEKKRVAARKVVAACKKFGIDASGFAKDHGVEGGLDGKWIEVFRAGEYGGKGSYTESDLDQMVSNYDPAQHEAPLVLGHPQHDAPAMGWVEALKRQGQVLMAKLRQVQPQLEDFVRSGMFTKRSISFYRNPLALRHVGFLGAPPPEVKGLAAVKFADRQFEQLEFNEEGEMDFSEMEKSLLEKLKTLLGIGTPKTFSGPDLAKAVEDATKALQDKLTAVATQFDEQKKKVEDAAAAAAARSKTELAETAIRSLKDAKKWIPAFDKMGVPQIFAELAKSDAKVSFGEGDKKKEKTPLEVFSDFLKSLPEIVPSGVIASAAAKAHSTVKFTESPRLEAAPESIAVHAAATARAAEQKISFSEALTQIYAEQSAAAASQA